MKLKFDYYKFQINIDFYNSRRGYGIYSNTTHDVEVNNTNFTLYDINEYVFGIQSVNSKLDLSNVNIEVYNSNDTRGIYADTDTNITATNTNVNLHDNTVAYGLYINSAVVTLKTGGVNSSATTAYGIYMTSGTYTQGIYDGRGTENADVSINNPEISSNGTTGIGISMGNGTMNYYDGSIYGSTSAFATGDIVSETEKNYQLLLTDDNKSCVLEYTR